MTLTQTQMLTLICDTKRHELTQKKQPRTQMHTLTTLTHTKHKTKQTTLALYDNTIEDHLF